MAGPLLAVLGPTATGKSALALTLAEGLGGEIINCDSTAVYRGFDIGTDKVPLAERRGIPHHLVDIVEPTDEYTAARYVSDTVAAIEQIYGRGHWPIIVGGTGLYYRALARGLFPGPGADAEMRRRLEQIAQRRGGEFLHRMLARVDPASAGRIQPRDRKRMIRALEVFFLTGTPLTARVVGAPGNVAQGVTGALRADYTGAAIVESDPTIGQFFNTAAFSIPEAGTFGNSQRNSLLGPGSWQVDLALSRIFQVRENQRLEFRAESFNVTNSTRFKNPTSNLTSLNTFGLITSSEDARIMQFALKYVF
jgi:hypothetical protein